MFSLDESCFLQTSDVGLNNMRARINPAVCECLEAAGGLIVWGLFFWHTLGPLVPNFKQQVLLLNISIPL